MRWIKNEGEREGKGINLEEIGEEDRGGDTAGVGDTCLEDSGDDPAPGRSRRVSYTGGGGVGVVVLGEEHGPGVLDESKEGVVIIVGDGGIAERGGKRGRHLEAWGGHGLGSLDRWFLGFWDLRVELLAGEADSSLFPRPPWNQEFLCRRPATWQPTTIKMYFRDLKVILAEHILKDGKRIHDHAWLTLVNRPILI